MQNGYSVVYPVPHGVVTFEGRREWERALPGLVRLYYQTLQARAKGTGIIGTNQVEGSGTNKGRLFARRSCGEFGVKSYVSIDTGVGFKSQALCLDEQVDGVGNGDAGVVFSSTGDGGAAFGRDAHADKHSVTGGGVQGGSLHRCDTVEVAEGQGLLDSGCTPEVGRMVGNALRGPNYLRNKAAREKKFRARVSRLASEAVPIVVDKLAHLTPELRATLERKWVAQNEAETKVLRHKVDAMNLHPEKFDGNGNWLVSSEVSSFEEARLRAAQPSVTWVARREEENLLATARARAQLEKLEREKLDGTLEKKYRAEVALLDGKLDGRYSLVAPKFVTGFAKTVVSATSSQSSGAEKRSLWSGGSVGDSVSSALSARERKFKNETLVLQSEVKELKDQIERSNRGYQGDWE